MEINHIFIEVRKQKDTVNLIRCDSHSASAPPMDVKQGPYPRMDREASLANKIHLDVWKDEYPVP